MKINKLCNAFFPDADIMKLNFGFLGAPVNDAVDNFKQKHGGLWVGGRLMAGEDKLIFRQNLANRLIHTSDNDLCIDISDIDKVWWEFGWFTGIVNVRIMEIVLRFRCYGAKQVVAALNELIATRRSSAGDVPKSTQDD